MAGHVKVCVLYALHVMWVLARQLLMVILTHLCIFGGNKVVAFGVPLPYVESLLILWHCMF